MPIMACIAAEDSPTLWPYTVAPAARRRRMFSNWIS